jgi:putative glycosyltransferase (TIGR04348 family)
MNALIVTPAPEGSLTGNRQTAVRWAGMLSRLHHTPRIVEQYGGESCDLMIALHAAKSATSIARFHEERPQAPLVVALTGTDLYRDLRHGETARRAIERATLLIALQPLAADELAEEIRPRVRVILQSAKPVPDPPPPANDRFEICVLGHLRPVKDPFRTAEAARLLPTDSRVRVLHVGAALQPEMERCALEEQASNPRYRWLGPLPRDAALRVLARSRLLVLSSLMEGGANVIGEAVVNGVPIIASRIAGSVGLLGADYPGYFATGETDALADLIRRAETDPRFHDELRARCRSLAADFAPDRECEVWSNLLAELFPV